MILQIRMLSFKEHVASRYKKVNKKDEFPAILNFLEHQFFIYSQKQKSRGDGTLWDAEVTAIS